MDFSSVLRQQNQTKMHSESQRMKNEHNLPVDPKTSRSTSASDLSGENSENKDPKTSELTKRAPGRPGVSRLPVLAKSLCLQTPSSFSQTHCNWEEKSLAGKAKRNKPYSRPAPFKPTSQSRSSTVDKHQVQTTSSAANVHPRTHRTNVKPPQQSETLNRHVGSAHKAQRKTKDTNTGTSRQPGAQSTLPSSSTTADTCLKNMDLLSLKDPAKMMKSESKQETQVKGSKESTGENFQADHAAFLSILRNEGVSTADLRSATPHCKPYNYEPQRVSVMRSRKKAAPTAGENFQPDHTAFLSILRNEGIGSTDSGSATPHSKPCNNVPLRVSVMKSRQKAAANTGSSKSVQFSPDAAALQSILRNEGVTTAGLGGATPRVSVCPPGRGTSIYTAQRVPIRKKQAEVTGRAVVTLKETPGTKWTPQRVRDTRHQPMSAMKWHQSAQKSVVSPRVKSSNVDPLLPQEKIVQRLFDDQEEDPDTNVTEEEKVEKSSEDEKQEEKEEEELEEEEKDEEQQRAPFHQEPQRQSVIFFSTSKKFSTAARFENRDGPCDQDRLGPSSGVAETHGLINPSLQSVRRELTFQKSSSLNPAVALLRKRLPPLEDLRMDEEVATYTAMSVPVTPGFVPPRPRCGNPLASILHFEESSRFVPICLDVSSDPSSPHSFSPKQR